MRLTERGNSGVNKCQSERNILIPREITDRKNFLTFPIVTLENYSFESLLSRFLTALWFRFITSRSLFNPRTKIKGVFCLKGILMGNVLSYVSCKNVQICDSVPEETKNWRWSPKPTQFGKFIKEKRNLMEIVLCYV